MAIRCARRLIGVLVSVLAVLATAVAIIATAAPAGARATPVCLPVQLTGVGQDQGPDKAGNLHTTAVVSLGRVKIGTTNATFTPTGPPAGTVLSFGGPIVFLPRFGAATLTATVQGSVDLAAGTFLATSTGVTGTGVFSGASGELTFRGTENLTTGAFTETITGRLCSTVALGL